jgi:membrane protein required for colicin V production
MNAFDIVVLIIVGIAAIGGFMRGFVQEVLSLAAWGVAILAIYFLHTDLTALIFERFDSPVGASILAFVLLLIFPYAIVRIVAAIVGKATRNSLLGPIDRVLGFGFGAVKGVVVAVMGFSLLVLGYDNSWGEQGRPSWMTSARSYTFVNASAEMMVQLIKERHELLMEGAEEVDGA